MAIKVVKTLEIIKINHQYEKELNVIKDDFLQPEKIHQYSHDIWVSLKTTNVKHITGKESVNDIYGGALLYSTPAQPAIDQNTVDQQVEIAKYTENGIRFDAAFTRLNGAFKGLLKALRGD